MKLEINYKKKTGNHKYVHDKQHAVYTTNGSMKKSGGELNKYLETNENGNTMFQNLWGSAKAVLRGKFRVIQACLKKQEKKSQIKNLTLHLKKRGKEQIKLNTC